MTAVHIGEPIDNEFKGKRIHPDVVAYAAHLRDAPVIAQENMLLAVSRFQKRLPARDIIEGDNGAEST